jgi:hypothetical protein
MTIPTREEVCSAATKRELQTINEAEASKIRTAVLQELRADVERMADVERIEAFVHEEGHKNPLRREATKGAIVDAIATGIEIGIHIGEARSAKR